MGQKAVLHTNRLASALALLVAFWFAPAVTFAKNNTGLANEKAASAIDISFTSVNVSCAGGANGAITATPTGGTGPYTFLWSNGKTTGTITGLTAGWYTVIVTDATGAQATGQKEVLQPLPLGSGASNVQNQICQFNPDGIALAWSWGGVQPHSYLWSNGATTAQISGLAIGTYTVTVTDANGCTTLNSVTILDNTAEGIWIVVNNDLVCPGQLGTLHAGAMSGTPPYTYTWSNGQTGEDIFNLTPGNYTVTVSDASGCSGSVTGKVEQLGAINASATSTNAGCNGAGGTATVNATGGSGTYTYSWSNGQTTKTISNLAAGTYTVTVTDTEGCSATAQAVVQTSGGSNLVLTTTVISNANCNGTGGSATVSVTGGTGALTYLWSNGQTTATATNLSAGTHTVTVTDAAGCTSSKGVTITATGSVNVSTSGVTSATCTTGGSATASGSGGTAPYTYKWDNGQTTATATNLSTGAHTVTVTDAAGCTGTASVTIQGPPSGPNASITNQTNANCTTGGSATVTATGGTPPYTYVWSNGQTTQTATNLSAGLHSVTVTDAAGCTTTTSTTITGSTNAPTVSVSVLSSATCTTGGSATATATGGTSPYTFKWDNNQTTATASNLAPGLHTVTVTDAAGCSAVGSVNMTVLNSPTATATVVTSAVCNKGGSATVTASGGTPPYTYKWDNNETTATATNLSAGPHSVTVTDAAGCTVVATVTMTSNPLVFTLTVTVLSHAICDKGGSATTAVVNGTSPYTYKWSNGATTSTVTNLAGGTYTVTATDANGCTSVKSVTINNQPGTKIGDYVWYDDSQNGYQDAAETNGLSGVAVALQTAGVDGNFGTNDDVTVLSTSTNAAGYYLFDCVPPGTYILKFTGLPSGYQWSKKNAVNNDCLDSDVNSAGRTDQFTVTAGMPDNLCYDAGVHTVCDNVISPGSVCCDQTICEGETPALLYNTLLPFGGTGAIEYQWLQLVKIGQSAPSWIGIPGATSKDYQPGPLYQTSSYMRCARRAGCFAFLESNIVTITVKPAGSQGCPTPYIAVSGSLLNNTTVALNWKTKAEFLDLTYFVEHSMDKNDWKTVAVVPGRHIETGENDYAYMHATPLVGANYYRVKRLNPEGDAAYSDLVEVGMFMDVHHTVKFWPNPVTDEANELNIQNLMEYDQAVSIDFIDPSGKLLRSVTLPKDAITKKVIDLSSYPSGIFFARIQFGDGEVETVRLSKVQK